MDELVFYNARGNPQDKKHSTAFAYLASLHTTKVVHQYRQCPSSPNASVNVSIGHGSHLLVALPERPVLHVYLYGKESPEQIIPLPEILTSLTIYRDSNNNMKGDLLLGGSNSGRLYIWSLNSGLLLSVKQAHYQPLTHITTYSGFIATGSKDSRIVIYTINSLFMNNNENNENEKPYAILTDHTLEITSLTFTKGLNNDIKLISSSLDSTIRIYSLTISAKLITTIVSTNPITSFVCDPAMRAIYIGMNNGNIRYVPLFKINPKNKIIESVGGLGKIITLKPDTELLDTITVHAENHKDVSDIKITCMKLSFDGTLLITGDNLGSLYVIDITTKQIRKKMKDLVGEICNIELWNVKDNEEKLNNTVDKNLMRNIPVLKRSIIEGKDLINQCLTMRLTGDKTINSSDWNFQSFINNVQSEEQIFANFSSVDSTTTTSSGGGVTFNTDSKTITDLKDKISKKDQEYTDLKAKYDELLLAYTASLK
ncbi:chromatin-binding/pre-rRNA-processing protein [Pichia kluyveri]|uniref:Pre-rRNA-processing protein IPI3 n=1 Tax=Pichia kluyveri TaxID=36015 RepID=A0AAV5RAP0_PICKL|nr:chromatin-binding/pre-rRNA-processing protein [Pichia kluyveri]